MPFCADNFYRQYSGGVEGFGLPVVLLHGGGGTHMGWPSDLRRIPNQNIYAIDLPGHGQSRHPACLSLNGLVDRLDDFFTCMGFYHLVLVGFSMGGALALSYASLFPKRIRKLALISCGSHFNIPEGIMPFLRPPVNKVKAMNEFSQAAFHPSATPAFRRKILEPLYSLDPVVLAADFHIGRTFRYRTPETTSKIPTLLVGGAYDQISPIRAIRQLQNFSSRTQLEIIPDAGHMVIYEKTRQVRDRLVNFLES